MKPLQIQTWKTGKIEMSADRVRQWKMFNETWIHNFSNNVFSKK